MNPNRSRLSRWRSASSRRQDDDEDVDPHTIIVSAPPPEQAQGQTQTQGQGQLPGQAPTSSLPQSRPQSASPAPPTATGDGSNLQLPPRYSVGGSNRRLGSISSRRSYNLPTPDATEESETEYFPPLGTTSSAVSRTSSIRGRAPSTAGSESGRPVYERTRQPSIRIRRSSSGASAANLDYASESSDNETRRFGARPRSISQPMPPAQVYDANAARHSRRVPQLALPRLTEEGSRPTMAELGMNSPISPARSLPEDPLEDDDARRMSVGSEPSRRLTRKRKISRLFWPGGSINRGSQSQAGPADAQQNIDPARAQPQSDEYGEDLVDWLDIIDPEVQTLSTLTNVQNSLFVPDLGPWINRRPTYVLSPRDAPLARLGRPAEREREREREEELPPADDVSRVETGVESVAEAEAGAPATLRRSDTITSRLTDSHYAALPHGFSLEGWTEEEKLELDDRVRHMLHSRRSRFKRTMKGFGQYVRRPLGFFVTLYATLITLFGLAWVLFLIGWIYVGDKQVYTIHIIDSVLVALFAIMGDGLAPFRAVDTYHMAFVVHYSRKIAKAKKQKLKDKEAGIIDGIPGNSVELSHCASGDPLADNAQVGGGLEPASAGASVERIATSNSNLAASVPVPQPEQAIVGQDGDVEAAKLDIEYDEDSPLTYKQWKRMRHHQKKLAKSHSFYKPDETFTHHAFPLAYLIAIVILLDCHSCLQISLGATTWGIDYHHRPFAITTVILCVSITCNITAGLVITIGDRKTRKKDVWKLLTRQELTGDAIKHLETKRAKEQSRSHDSSQNSTQDNFVQSEPVIIKEDN